MHPEPGPEAGPLGRWLAGERGAIARRHVAGFTAAGASDVAIVAGPPDDLSFGARLRALVDGPRPAGLVVLGSGSIPLATDRDRRAFVAAAGAEDRIALANNRYSADVIAIARPWPALASLPDLATDNALPRWLASEAGHVVSDLGRRWRLAVDIDGPLDLVVLGSGRGQHADVDIGPVTAAVNAVRAVAADRTAELLILGRTSAATLAWLERSTASRTRALVEERGLQTAVAGQRDPVSVLGMLLDRDGPSALGAHLVRLAEAAVLDTRVLLAHRFGAERSAWPSDEDRYASDLLLPDGIVDPWLRELTRSAIAAPIPVLLGGHTLVGPGIRLILGKRSWT